MSSIGGFAAAEDSTSSVIAKEANRPLVQIALLLDTSNSMDGLIEQAKSQLWKICNEFIKARQGSVAPEVQVALYEYGNSGLSRESGWDPTGCAADKRPRQDFRGTLCFADQRRRGILRLGH